MDSRALAAPARGVVTAAARLLSSGIFCYG
jgi:hypothetical protein